MDNYKKPDKRQVYFNPTTRKETHRARRAYIKQYINKFRNFFLRFRKKDQ